MEIVLPGILKRLGCNLYVSLKQPVGPYFSNIPKIFNIQNIFSSRYKGDEERVTWEKYLYWFVLGKLNILKSSRLIAASEFIKDYLTESLGYPENKIDVIVSGVGPKFRKLSQIEKEEGRKRLNLPENFLFTCGNVVPRKIHETAIHALKIIREKFPNLNLHLIIAGGTADPHYNKVSIEACKLGVNKNVIFTGFLTEDDLADLYNCALVFIFPSLSEAAGIVAMEAMACGLPVVASKRGGIPEICGGVEVYIDDPRNYEAFAEAACSLLDRDNRRIFEKKALSRARNFSWEQAAIKLLHTIERVSAVR